MIISVDIEFKEICLIIIRENKSELEWSKVESDDMFQSKSYTGGFDATEMAFCFSYYDKKRNEYWFQLTLNEIKEICSGKKTSFEGKLVEH